MISQGTMKFINEQFYALQNFSEGKDVFVFDFIFFFIGLLSPQLLLNLVEEGKIEN